ncbi:TlpA family protein disulfide reductase [bacterium]|nr:MAG: TlpA family protein disulfide reductase [bacterium]
MHTIKFRYLAIGLGLFATSIPAFAQAPMTPAISTQPNNTPPTPVPATDPQAKALFTQTLDRYRALKSLSTVYERSGRKQLIEFYAPQSLKVSGLDSLGAVTSQTFYTDTEVISLRKPNDTYEWTTATRPPAADGKDARSRVATPATTGGPIFSSILAGIDPFADGGRYKATSYTLGTPTTVDGVAVTPVAITTEKSATQPFETTLTFVIGKQDGLIHSIETGIKLPNGREGKTAENFTAVKADAGLTEASFNFTAPEGATKVEQFSRAQVRAKVGELPLALPTGTKDIDGKDIVFEQFKGKVTLVDFWATWCGPCIAELPNVKANYDKYKGQGFDVLGISLDQTIPPLTKYIKDKEMPWRQVYDGYWDGPIATSFNVRAIPATILIGKDGKIAAVGARGDKLEPAIQAALAAQ